MTGRHTLPQQPRRWTTAVISGAVFAAVGTVVGFSLSATGAVTGSPNETCSVRVQNGILDENLSCTPDSTAPTSSAPPTSASPTVSPTPSSTPTATATTPPPTMTESPTQLPAGGYPNASTTGVPAGTALTTINGNDTVTTPNTTITGKHITGELFIKAANVTITDSQIDGGVNNTGTQKFVITDSTIGGTSGCDGGVGIGVGNYTATRVKIRGFGDGLRDSGDNITITDSFVVLCSNPGDHSDGVQGYYGGSNVVIHHNTIDQRPAAPYWTSPIFLGDESKATTITDNLVAGGSYSLRWYNDTGKDGASVVTGNRIVVGAWDYGPINSNACPTTTFSDNRLVTIDAGYDVTKLGSAVSCG